MKEWLVKVKRYGGGESIIAREELEWQAEDLAGAYNRKYQTDTYYVEKYDPEKAKGFGRL